MTHRAWFPLVALWALSPGCAADPGTRPHEMSAAQHQAAADEEMVAAQGHVEQHDPNAANVTETCDSRSGSCWTSISNPTAQHREDADRHRELAAKHRAASAALADAEARACLAIPEADRDQSPFYHREDIQSVSPLTKETQDALSLKTGQARKTEIGVTVVFRPVKGLTAEWLQRLIDCHLARAASVGHEMPEMSYCPLVPKGVEARVTSTGNGFAVNISATDKATIQEIKKRAGALLAR